MIGSFTFEYFKVSELLILNIINIQTYNWKQ